MSHRHSRADHDVRLHEPPRQHILPPHPAHAPSHGPHLNGNGGLPATPGTLSNGSSHGVSPAAMPSAPVNGASATAGQPIISQLARENEKTWLTIGRVAEQMEDLEHALSAYENALRHNPNSLPGLTQVAHIARIKENYPKAIEYFDRAITLQEDNGELWSALGHCFLMQDDLQKAYNAYQQALYLLPNPKEDPKLWYGIGILYDRYGSLEHAEEAFASVLRMEKGTENTTEILFRLGIIYKQQQKYVESLAAFERILRSPPNPLAHADIYFQIGHVYEQQKDYVNAKQAYEQVVAENPNHAKVLQQLGWLYHQDGSTFQNQETAIQYLTKSLEADPSDPQSWYLLGRAYMAGQKYNKAYEAYQQAVYRDGRNPTFWCSIGVLYFQINQLRDALDAYSRAIRINPYISEVWYDLGSLYESCNNQISDAIDAYARASELDPTNKVITQRLELLRNAQATGSQLPAAPGPQDVHPTAYANAVVPPNGLSGPPLLLASAGSTTRPSFRNDSRDVLDNGAPLSHPSLNGRGSPPPRYRGAPPPINVDDSRRVSTHPPLAPMDVDRPASHREGSMRMHVHHSPISPHEAPRGMAADPYLQRPLKRQASMSASPQMQGVHELMSAPSPKQYSRYSSGRRSPVSTTPAIHHHHRRSSPPPPPRGYQELPSSRDMAWERPSERHHHHMEEDGRRGGGAHEASLPPPPPLNQRSRDVSPVSSHGGGRGSAAQWSPYGPGAPQPLHHERSSRYDPRYDGVSGGGYSGHRSQHRDLSSDSRHGSYATSPEVSRPGLPPLSTHARDMSPAPQDRVRPPRRSTGQQQKENVMVPSMPSPAPATSKPSKPSSSSSSFRGEPPAASSNGRQTPKAPPSALNAPPLKVSDIAPGNSSRSHSHRPQSATQPSPVHPRLPNRDVDDDYDDGVAEVLMDLAARPVRSPPEDVLPPPPPASASKPESPTRSMDSPSRYVRGSVSSNGSRHSPQGIKRPRSPASDSTTDSKRSRMDRDVVMRSATSPEPQSAAPSSSGGRPGPSSRPSPIPFRTQPSANSLSPPQSKTPVQAPPPPPASQALQPSLPSVLPPHPRPVGNAGGSSSSSSSNNNNNVMALPPIATLPASPDPSDDRGHLDNRMHIDEHISDSRDSRSGNGNNGGESGLRSRSASGSHSRRPSITYSPRDRDRNGPTSGDRERERERSSIMSPRERERERPNGAAASAAVIQRSQSRPSSGPGTPQTMVMSTPSPGGSSNNGGNGGQTLPKVEASA